MVTGYSTTPGTHVLTATATDNAGNTGTSAQTYTVKNWTAKGFYQPIDMGGVLSTVKAGSTVPAKFELFAGTAEFTDVSLVAMSASQITCTLSYMSGIELTATGNTSLRYDSTGGQFIYNWKTPATPGKCYQLAMTAGDGSTLSANFKLK
ncbi:PxKF domain-containing protein [Pseudarthrobacter sp. N5]|uniref:PxKF domain-containing protein n=1 Tax=Pseudarthrobacter sp. N5 TaxID=3418416 RepID=UPI003CF49879